MTSSQRALKAAQADIFATYDWYDRHNLLRLLAGDRVNYMASCVERVWGKGAFAQQEVLEVGCGGGLLCGELARRGLVVSGVDPSAESLAGARQYVDKLQLGQNVGLYEGSAESLPYADGSFSVVVCMDVLAHVQDLSATVREIARVLAPGGIFIFDTINRTFLARLVLIWIGERFFQRWGLVPGLHVHSMFIKPRELRAELVRNKLHIRELTGFMPGIVEGRLTLTPGGFKSVSYIGYATKE